MNEAEIVTPSYEQAFQQIDVAIFASALKIFRNTRTFFEQNEREDMKDSFYETLQPLAKQYLDAQEKVMATAYDEQWMHVVNKLKQRIEGEIDSMIDQNIKVLTDTVNLKMMEDKYQTIKQKITNIQEG